MIIHCTQKLLSELKPEVIDENPGDLFWSRYGNLLRFEKRKCVLLVSDPTLYTLPERTETDNYYCLMLVD